MIPKVDAEGRGPQHKCQPAAVARPILSAGEIYDFGNRVILGCSRGMVDNVHTGVTRAFRRVGRLYQIDLWFPPDEQQAEQKQKFHLAGERAVSGELLPVVPVRPEDVRGG